MGRLGRKICCEFNKNQKCILLVKGKKMCVYNETSKEQNEMGELQLGVCALLPQSERENFLASMKKEGFKNTKSWKD